MSLSYYATPYKGHGLDIFEDKVFDNLESAILNATDMLNSWHKEIHIKAVGYRGKEFHLFTITDAGQMRGFASGDED